MNIKNAPVLFLIVLLAALGLVAFKLTVPAAIALKTFEPQAVLGLLTWLFTVALFVERAVEVIVMILRDAGADGLQARVDVAQAQIEAAQKLDPAAPITSQALAEAAAALGAYRATTKEIALFVGFVLGILVALAGVRALGGIVAAPVADPLFTAVDALITGALLAGGSEGIHQMMNVFSNFMTSLAAKAKTT